VRMRMGRRRRVAEPLPEGTERGAAPPQRRPFWKASSEDRPDGFAGAAAPSAAPAAQGGRSATGGFGPPSQSRKAGSTRVRRRFLHPGQQSAGVHDQAAAIPVRPFSGRAGPECETSPPVEGGGVPPPRSSATARPATRSKGGRRSGVRGSARTADRERLPAAGWGALTECLSTAIGCANPVEFSGGRDVRGCRGRGVAKSGSTRVQLASFGGRRVPAGAAIARIEATGSQPEYFPTDGEALRSCRPSTTGSRSGPAFPLAICRG